MRYAIVTVDANINQLQEGAETLAICLEDGCNFNKAARHVYGDMLAAAPSPHSTRASRPIW